MSRWTLSLLLSSSVALSGCFTAGVWVAMPFLFEPAELPDAQVLRDLAYREDARADPDKHRLDLYLPRAPGASGEAWPLLVFVHGGGWTSGDKALRAGGRDIYANIGRFFAANGVGAALVNYRLQFGVTWREQVADVADAVAWLAAHAAGFGGDPDAIFLSGHSAGAQLVTRVALDRELAAERGLPRVCGLVPVSGAGYDLADDETYALGASRRYYERRFRAADPGDAWLREASALSFVTPQAPPALVLYAEDDWEALHRQARLLSDALRKAGVPARLLQVPEEDHYTVVLTLSSRKRLEAAPSILDFVRSASCRATPFAAGG
jgi:arylformamidase